VKGLSLAVLIGLTACNADISPKFLDEPLKTPIDKDYRKKAAEWVNRYFAEPRSARGAWITQPVPIRVLQGAELWLVCIELDVRAKAGDYMGVQRIALGFLGPTIVAPLDRSSLGLRNEDCNTHALSWRRFSELERLR
jgi:hypothetical protein